MTLCLQLVNEVYKSGKRCIPFGEESAYGGEGYESASGYETWIAPENFCFCFNDKGFIFVLENETKGRTEGANVARWGLGKSCTGCSYVAVAIGNKAKGLEGLLLARMQQGDKGGVEGGVGVEEGGIVSGKDEEEFSDHN
jgi:hypothetical protein